MEFDQIERTLHDCTIGLGDDDAGRADKRARRSDAVRDLALLLERGDPTPVQAYRLARVLDQAAHGDCDALELAERLARRAHAGSHPESGPLIARLVDRMRNARHQTQRYGTLRSTIAGQVRLLPVDPAVTDEERADLGLMPMDQLRREIDEANRIAAGRVAEHGLSAGAAIAVVPAPSASVLAEGLGRRREAVWRAGPDLVFCWKGSARRVAVWFGLELDMEQVAGTDLWALAVRVRDLDRACLSYRFLPTSDGVERRSSGGPSGQWRGPEAPGEPHRSPQPIGELRSVEIDSAALGECRKLSVYLPPGHNPGKRCGVLYATDQRVSAELVEPLILAGRIPPIVSVGVPFGSGTDGDRRAQEYLPGFHPERFEAHRRFFVREVSSWAERELGVTGEREGRAVFGVSNGAAFAAAMGVRHPEHFGSVIAFSLAITGVEPAWEPGAVPRHYFCAGSLEEGFDRSTSRWAAVVERAGAEVVHRRWVSGHDPAMWDGELPAALEWAFRIVG